MEDVMNADIPYYRPKNIEFHPSLESKLLLPLQTLGYGVPMHTFCPYYQMSTTQARDACSHFDNTILGLYAPEYLRLPTAADLRSILKLHKAVHGVDGMFGSLDCTHTQWKKCPVAWQGGFKGHKGGPTIILEAVCDHHLWFWHVSYGHAGRMNDINVLKQSTLYERFIDGSFAAVEREAGVVPFAIGTEEFNQLYVLVDGIYPAYSRFVKAVRIPATEDESTFTKWQEAKRKDIERGFGVSKGTWQFLALPIHLRDATELSRRVYTCLTLHNMLVSDRIMNDCRKRYDPAANLEEEFDEATVEQPPNLLQVQELAAAGLQVDPQTTMEVGMEGHREAPEVRLVPVGDSIMNTVGMARAPAVVQSAIVNQFRELRSKALNARLMTSVMAQVVENCAEYRSKKRKRSDI
jgi:hypothetical protein